MRKDTAMEKLSRNKECKLPMSSIVGNLNKILILFELMWCCFVVRIDLEASKKEWLSSQGPQHIKVIAEHFDIYKHLFGDAYFYPRVILNVAFEVESGYLPVCFGNVIKPRDGQKKPNVTYESDENTLWTLILANPDGHFTEQTKEYVHWFV